MSFNLIEGDVTPRSSGGVELATDKDVALVANARGFIGVGYDGTNTRFLRVDSSGRQIAVGAGAVGANPVGNPVLIGVSDGTNVRLPLSDTSGRQVSVGAAAHGAAPAGAPVLAAGWDETNVRRLLTTATGVLKVSISNVPADLSQIVSDFVRETGGSADMNVDGTTPVDFEFNADPTDDLFIQNIRVVLVPNVLRMDASSFGSLSALANGVRLQITSDGNTTEIANWLTTEDILATPGTKEPLVETGLTANDLLTASIVFGGNLVLKGGTGDKIQFRIRDDLTGAGPNSLIYFRASVYAIK